MTIIIEVNGDEKEVADGTTASALLDLLGLPDRGIAIAVDGAVHHRGSWNAPLADGARIDILTAVQGG
ncbi:sulfur carrier protein ThiS [Williamsia maris]|uniref:Sulfur carrier protein n=1 Tax=Williamsia maris TaxID=72806 RepID=A0ABT1HAZ8_9NOCA|nr:sulfur carrier protein ThiS [Williamsia maris]MCP2175369.1 sulfur carrier protein [Williamsia maris]